MDSRFIIYGLIDPRTGQLRYVGRSSSGFSRPRQHAQAHRWKKLKTHVASWVRSLCAVGMQPEIEVLETVATEAELNEAERWNIASFRSLGCDLTNHTVGGEGTVGYRMSDDGRRRVSEAKRGKPSGRLGMKLSPEHRQAMSRANMGKRPNHAGTKGMKLSPTHKAALLKALTGRQCSEETRRRRSHAGGLSFTREVANALL